MGPAVMRTVSPSSCIFFLLGEKRDQENRTLSKVDPNLLLWPSPPLPAPQEAPLAQFPELPPAQPQLRVPGDQPAVCQPDPPAAQGLPAAAHGLHGEVHCAPQTGLGLVSVLAPLPVLVLGTWERQPQTADTDGQSPQEAGGVWPERPAWLCVACVCLQGLYMACMAVCLLHVMRSGAGAGGPNVLFHPHLRAAPANLS